MEYKTSTKRDRNGRPIKYKVCRENSCQVNCTSQNKRIAFNNVAYAEVNIIMGFELMTVRNKPLIELLYGGKVDNKNKVYLFFGEQCF